MEEPNTQNNNGKRVLLVEDTTQLRDALDRYLRQEGLIVMAAVDGEEGIAKAKENTPDFILTDIFMPRLGGIDMVKQIRATDWGKDIPVMLLSNFTLDRDSLESVKQMGRLKYMTKADFSLKDVVQAAVNMMNRYQVAKEAKELTEETPTPDSAEESV